jgi:uncharacterized protein (TIGR00288 family)
MSNKKIAFLVDFDNVATDVIEQALNVVFKDYGAAHIRRAYCNAEQALREQNFLKRLGLRAIVNLAIGKNSTDIALAVDAMDLAITEKPDVIVLVSSDSDFAPLVLRLREKGAWLRGFGQYGKTGDGVIQIYDQFNELAHASGGRTARESAAPKPAGRNGRRGQGGRTTAGRPAPEPVRAATVARPVAAEPVQPPAPAISVEVDAPVVESTAPAIAAEPKAPARKAAAKSPKPAAKAAPAPAKPAAKSAAPAADKNIAAAKEINAMLAALPKLADGQWHDLGAAAKALKDAGLLPKTAPAAKLFRKHPHAFQLQPEKQPNQVRFGHG